MENKNAEAGQCCFPGFFRPWDWIEANPRKALQTAGVSLSEQDDAKNMRVHVVAEDPRYPTMCVNGNLNFGVSINAETGVPEGGRSCICEARASEFCVCDLETTPKDDPRA